MMVIGKRATVWERTNSNMNQYKWFTPALCKNEILENLGMICLQVEFHNITMYCDLQKALHMTSDFDVDHRQFHKSSDKLNSW